MVVYASSNDEEKKGHDLAIYIDDEKHSCTKYCGRILVRFAKAWPSVQFAGEPK